MNKMHSSIFFLDCDNGPDNADFKNRDVIKFESNQVIEMRLRKRLGKRKN